MNISFFGITKTDEYLCKLEETIKNEGFLEKSVLDRGLKHAAISFVLERASRFAVDLMTEQRDIYSGQSQRYVRYTKNNLEFYLPKSIKKISDLSKKYSDSVRFAIDTYIQLLHLGIPDEDARFIFPRCIESNMKFTITGEKLIDFFSYLLNSEYEEFIAIGNKLLDKLKKPYPHVASNIVSITKKQKLSYSKIYNFEKMFLSKNSTAIPIIQAHTEDPITECALGATVCYHRGSPTEYFEDIDLKERIDLVNYIKKAGHYSVLEHAFVTISFSMSEISQQQLRRHRIPMRSSSRLEWLLKNFDYVIPPTIKSNVKTKKLFDDAIKKIRDTVNQIVKGGISEYDTLYVLPNATKVNVVLTTNFRDLIHILELRLCQRAQWEIREWAYNLLKLLISEFPTIFSDVGPQCFHSKCREGKYSCGHPETFIRWRKNILKKLQKDLKTNYYE